MQFDPNNKIVQLCAQGMDMEGHGKPEEASRLFLQAWQEAANNFEKSIAAHYVARHQPTITDRLYWDETALGLAQEVEDEDVKAHYPSLYLNIAKDYEDLHDAGKARQYYEWALSYASFLPDDEYGAMIRSGIKMGMERVS
jgi:hypothetical protein